MQNFLAWAELLLGKGCLRNRVSEDTRAQGTTPADTWEATFLSKCANKKLKSAASKNHSFGVRMKTHFGAPSTNAHRAGHGQALMARPSPTLSCPRSTNISAHSTQGEKSTGPLSVTVFVCCGFWAGAKALGQGGEREGRARRVRKHLRGFMGCNKTIPPPLPMPLPCCLPQ